MAFGGLLKLAFMIFPGKNNIFLLIVLYVLRTLLKKNLGVTLSKYYQFKPYLPRISSASTGENICNLPPGPSVQIYSCLIPPMNIGIPQPKGQKLGIS